MEKNKENYLVLVLFVCVTLAFGGGYLLGNSVIKSDDVVEKKENNEVKENIDVDKLGRELFEKYSLKGTDNDLFFFSSIDYSYADISTSKRLVIALLNPNDFYTRFNNSYEDDLGNINYRIDLNSIENSYRYYFGNKPINYEPLEWVSFYAIDLGFIECLNVDNENMYCKTFDGGSTWSGESFVEYDYSVLKDNKLEVYVNFLAIDAPYNYKFCSDYSCNNIIDETVYTEDIEVLDINEIFEKYEGKTGVYKMVFEKDADGNYYWVETDVVKK